MWALQFAFRWNWCIWIQLYWFIYIDSFILIYIAWFAVYWLWSILIDLCWFIWIYIVRLAMLPIRWCPRWLQLFQAVCCVRNLTPATYADVREWSVDYWAGSLALQALQALALRMPCFQKSPFSARLGRADDCCEAMTPQDEITLLINSLHLSSSQRAGRVSAFAPNWSSVGSVTLKTNWFM